MAKSMSVLRYWKGLSEGIKCWRRSERKGNKDSCLETGTRERGTRGPVAELGGIATDPDPCAQRGSWAVEDEEHEPSWWGNTGIGRSIHGASKANAFQGGYQGARRHGVAVCARRS
jgi:hypothetical protein